MEKLSNREYEVLEGIVIGLSNPEIGNLLGISKETVKIHVKEIFRKLDVTNRVVAAVYAVKSGIVSTASAKEHLLNKK